MSTFLLQVTFQCQPDLNVFLSVRCLQPYRGGWLTSRPPPTASAPPEKEGESSSKDWVFINYTFKRFEGLTQRGLARSARK